jgi:Peptidase family C25
MTPRFLSLAAAVLGLGALALPALGATTVEREFRYERSRITLDVADGRATVRLAGGVRDFTPGRPDLPLASERVDLPDGWQVSSVALLSLETEPLADAVRPWSTLVPKPGSDVEERSPEDAAAFSAAGFQPAVPVRLGAQGLERGHGVALLLVSPVRWDAATGRLERVARMRVQLTLEPARFPDPAPRERVVREWEGGLGRARTAEAARAAAIEPPARGATPFAATQVPSLLGSPVAYVIITNDEMASEFQRLADWKTRSGLPAVVRTMSFIRQQYPRAADDAERVRLFIRDAYSRWSTQWVLLGGDTDVMPERMARTEYYGGENIPCDLYFACLDGNWNADGDSLYGEAYLDKDSPGDFTDLFPEVYVGRAPTSTVAQAKLFVDKSLQYVTDPDASGYQNKLLFFAEVLFPQNWSPGMITTLDGAQLVEEVLPYVDLNACVRSARLYENYLDSKWRPGATQERRAYVIDSLNSGYNIAVHVGHGYRNVMSVGDDNFSNSDALALTNGRRLTNLYAIDCTSNAIDFPCLGEAFLHAPGGGAVTNVGSTRYDFPTSGRDFQREYFRLFYQDSVNAVGELQARQKLPYIAQSTADGAYRWTELTLLLLGDPELRIYSCVPRVITVERAASMSLADTLYPVTVSIDGVPQPNARVTAYKPGADFYSTLTDDSGNATLMFHPDSIGSFQLTVTAFNSKPYQADVPITAVAQAALSVDAPTVDDDDSGGTIGNGDGAVDAGETVDLMVPLRNNGGSSSGAVTATLTTTDAEVTIVSPTQVYDAVPPGGTMMPSAGFRLTVPYSVDDRVPARSDRRLRRALLRSVRGRRARAGAAPLRPHHRRRRR